MNNEKDKMIPKWDHNCDNCVYLGTDSKGCDWYVCTDVGNDRNIIRRYGFEPHEYESSPIAGTIQMTRLERLAARMGFEFTMKEIHKFGLKYIKQNTEYKSHKDSLDNGPLAEDENLLSKKRV